MSRSPAMRRAAPRVLVVKLSSLGDIIHATGCFRALRATLPDAHITLAVDARWSGAVRHDPHLDALVLSSPASRLTLAYLREVRRRLAGHGPFDLAIDLQGTRRSAAWMYLSGARTRVGRGAFRPGWQRVLQPDLTRHAVAVCADICAAAGIPVSAPDPALHTGPEAEAALDRLLDGHGIARHGFVVLNPFSRWRSKSLPLDSAAAMITRLPSHIREALVISGGPEDISDARALAGRLGHRPCHSFVGQLSLDEALCLYRRARLMVSCDSGPMHAAAAFGVPVIALFGPTHPERTGPWGTGHTILQARRPISHHTYREDRECLYMQSLDPDRVVDAVVAHWERGDSA